MCCERVFVKEEVEVSQGGREQVQATECIEKGRESEGGVGVRVPRVSSAFV